MNPRFGVVFAAVATITSIALAAPAGAYIAPAASPTLSTSSWGSPDSDSIDYASPADVGYYISGEYGDGAQFGATRLGMSGDKRGLFVGKVATDGTFNWVKTFGGPSTIDKVEDDLNGAATATDGGYLVAGTYADTATFGSITLNTEAKEIGADYAAKISSAGEWLWAIKLPHGATVSGISPAPGGGAYFTGAVDRALIIGGTTVTPRNQFSDTAYVAKVDANGNYLWVQPILASGKDFKTGQIAQASDGGAILAGVVQKGASVKFGSKTLCNGTACQGYVAKISSSGSWQWSYPISAGSSNYSPRMIFTGLAETPGGDVVLSGYFYGASIKFGAKTLVRSGGNGDQNGFLAQMSANGTWKWSLSAGGGQTFFTSLAVARDGRVIASGYGGPGAKFGSTTLAKGRAHSVIAKISATGSFSWVYEFPVKGDFNEVMITSVVATQNGGAALGGYLFGSLSLGGKTLTSKGYQDAFLTKISSTGSLG